MTAIAQAIAMSTHRPRFVAIELPSIDTPRIADQTTRLDPLPKMGRIIQAATRTSAATPGELARHGLRVNQDGTRRSAFDLLSHPGIDLTRLVAVWPELGAR